MDTRLFFACGSSVQWGLSMKVAQLLGSQGPWQRQVCSDTECFHCRSYGPIRVFFWASGSWRSEGLFFKSFSITLPIQALRGFLFFPLVPLSYLVLYGSIYSFPVVRYSSTLSWCSASTGVWRCIPDISIERHVLYVHLLLAILFPIYKVLPHPPYSFDLSPTNYHFFKHLNNFLQGKCFHNQQDAKSSF